MKPIRKLTGIGDAFSVEPRVSLVGITFRPKAIDVFKDTVMRQTFKDMEVIIVDKNCSNISSTEWNHIPVFFIPDPPKPSWAVKNLSNALNEGIKHSNGELIVLLQDFIWVPDDGIEKFWKRYEQEPKGLCTGISHQYKEPSSLWAEHEVPPKPSGEKSFSDPRVNPGSYSGFYVTQPVIYESNWASMPKKAWEDVGGFDTEFDKGWGYDNCNFAERCQMAGYHVFLDTDNEVFCYSHINLFDEQKRRDDEPNNQKIWSKKYSELSQGLSPWKLQ